LLIFLDNQDVTSLIRLEEAGYAASKVAQYQCVRDALLDFQRNFAKLPGLVADGRDMGTVVFPCAFLKIFLTASREERAKRRYKQLNPNENSGNLAALLREIDERDRRDSSRSVAPLQAASDAIEIDSTDLSIEQVVSGILSKAKESGLIV
jgi:cytidylate kinase